METERQQVDHSEDFDIEKWCTDNPPDYFKAIELLMSSDNNEYSDVLFKAIYKVFQMYIPHKLFKYQSLGTNQSSNGKRFETIRNRKIYTSSVQDLNDPFDPQGFILQTNHRDQEKNDEDYMINVF